MSALLYVVLAALVLFGIIVFYNVRYTIKQRPKQEKSKEKVEKQIKPKVKKEKKERTKIEMLSKDQFLRPSDIVKKQQEEKRKQLEEQKKLEEAKLAKEMEEQSKKVKEGESIFTDYEDAGDGPLTEEKPEPAQTVEDKEISDEIKSLSPELKALLFGDVLKPKE